MNVVLKRILFTACIAALFIAAVLPFSAIKSVKADDYVKESYQVEITGKSVKLPVPDISETWAYRITLKKSETVLGENITEYLFEEQGEYTLVYSIYVDGSLTDVIEKTASLSVSDKQTEDEGCGCGCSGNIGGGIPTTLVLASAALFALMKIKNKK